MAQISNTSGASTVMGESRVSLAANAIRAMPVADTMSAPAAPWQLRSTFFVDISNRTLGDIVRRQKLIMLAETATVQLACRIMRDRSIGAILVTGMDGRLAGLFTGRDAVCRVVAEGLDPETTLLCAVMTLEPDALCPDKRAIDALRMMHAGGYRHLPVVDGWKPVGIVSLRDVTPRYGPASVPS